MEHEKSYTVYNEPFRLLVTGLIESEDIDVRELVKGLCDIEEWEKLLNGEKLMSKLFMDRILHRLGGYVKSIDMLLYDDGYEDWKMRMEIVFAIEDNKLDYAKEVLKKYTVRKKCEGRSGLGSLNKKLEYQFILMMKAQLMILENEDSSLILQTLKEAAGLTIPGGVAPQLHECILCEQEINILLEYYYISAMAAVQEGKPDKKYISDIEKIIAYIDGSKLDLYLRVRIFPKAVYYLLKADSEDRVGGQPEDENVFDRIVWDMNWLKRKIDLCNKAIDMLKSTERGYFLAELLDIRADALDKMKRMLSDELFDRLGYRQRSEDTQKWQEMLAYLERIMGMSLYMKSYCYLYVENDVHNLGDAIASRRKALGLSQSRLAEGICDEKTLRRAEHGTHRLHARNMYELLDRVMLSSEFQSSDVIAFSSREYGIAWEAQRAIQNKNIDAAEESINELKRCLDMSYVRNIQFIERTELRIRQIRGQVGLEEYSDSLKRILGYSIPYEQVLKNKKMYLTNEEILCIQNIMLRENTEEKAEKIDVFMSICEKYESVREELFIVEYELFMPLVASYVGNMGRLDESNEMFERAIKADLRLRRFDYVDRCLYGLCWNADMQHRLTVEEKAHCLKKCIDITSFNGNVEHRKFYIKMLDELSLF